MSWPDILSPWMFTAAWILMGTAAAVIALSLWRGPTTADRLVAVELLAAFVVAAAMLAVADSRMAISLDLALVLGVIGFMGSSAVAGMLQNKGGDE